MLKPLHHLQVVGALKLDLALLEIWLNPINIKMINLRNNTQLYPQYLKLSFTNLLRYVHVR